MENGSQLFPNTNSTPAYNWAVLEIRFFLLNAMKPVKMFAPASKQIHLLVILLNVPYRHKHEIFTEKVIICHEFSLIIINFALSLVSNS